MNSVYPEITVLLKSGWSWDEQVFHKLKCKAFLMVLWNGYRAIYELAFNRKCFNTVILLLCANCHSGHHH